MEVDQPSPTSFDRIGPAEAASPIVLSVPHAGRDYPPRLIERARLPLSRLRTLEDRHIDQVVAPVGEAAGAAMIIARRARAWIDLNRDPREIDPGMIVPEPPPADVIRTAKVKGGLGLVPRSIGTSGEISAGRLPLADLHARIANDHAPYHHAIAAALRAARARFGVALLIDCHSMPSIVAAGASGPARIVVGDRFGASADPRFTRIATASAGAAGFMPALNAPYPGGYTLDRHGDPARGIHALQIEIDRQLYLDDMLNEPGPGLARTMRWFRTLVERLSAELGAAAGALAAE